MRKTLMEEAFGDDAPELGATPAPPPEVETGASPRTDAAGFTVDLPPLPGRRRSRARGRIDFYVDAEHHAAYTELLRKARVQFDCSKGEFQDAVLAVALGQPAEIARTLREMLFEEELR